MAEANQTLIVNNTRVMEHLCVVVESLARIREVEMLVREYKKHGKSCSCVKVD